MNILVSIITPMYKGSSLIASTIDSALCQTYRNWEMIIVDDASPDEGAGIKVVERYIKKDSRIKLIKLDKNRGSSGARNAALKGAEGKLLAFLDSDDLWDTTYLETMLQHIYENKNPDVAIFYGSYRRMDNTCSYEILSPYKCTGKKDFKSLLFHCPIFPSAAILDTTRLKEKVFFREELKSLRDDYVFWLDIMKQGLYAYAVQEVLVSYRMRDDSQTSSKTKMIKPQWNVYRNVLNMNIFQSFFYLFSWAFNGFKKYKGDGGTKE